LAFVTYSSLLPEPVVVVTALVSPNQDIFDLVRLPNIFLLEDRC